MSIYKLELNVFRFDANKDYSATYEKCTLEYQKHFTLKNILELLPLRNFEYDKNISLKINGISIFEDVKVEDLVENFGKQWNIEPISTRYAYKDLLIDKNAVMDFYRNFFTTAEFLTQSEKDEFFKFININFISPQKNPDYFGDGFFLYIKWLLTRYPNEAKRFLESIADVKNGVMNFVSVADFIYPKNHQIDEEIFELQKMLTQTSRCPISGNTWAKLGKEIESRYIFPATNVSSEFSGKYVLFDGYTKGVNFEPLLIASSTLLEKNNKKSARMKFCYDGGYWGRFCDLQRFLVANAYNMALVHKNNAILLFCEQDAYCNAIYAKSILDGSIELTHSINEELKKYNLVYDSSVKIEYLNKMIAKEFEIPISDIFSGFSTILYKGTSSSSINEICYEEFFEKISLKKIETIFENECYYHLLEINEVSCLEQSAIIRYEGIDLGTDFLCTLSMGEFEMFDTYAKKASKIYKRDFDATPTLFLPQIALLGMGEKDLKRIGLHLHKNRVSFI
ncbi:DUF5644 domain-containing protein [Helicobacter cappadocius]|uniref:DUF5644 domain-containing protein n=1 Tax=Helicobacter cappadocius TaxID=3063998 RepID=A0AA90TFE2_9HELI|nr:MULTISPECIES: DUF5644 domain-containing protein [unclassified Helicobacter]MDO7253612.1 DUF5644 domain-containing protein [Helicobacter sp. faydin-H75]MDP2539540.1 DUF5644 domain-containing protein [Helicobacter sp. faydin-H76]